MTSDNIVSTERTKIKCQMCEEEITINSISDAASKFLGHLEKRHQLEICIIQDTEQSKERGH